MYSAQVYEIKPEEPAPLAAACRVTIEPSFSRTVVLKITSMGNLCEK